MRTITSIKQRWHLYLLEAPPKILYRQCLYWGIVAIFGLIILLTSYHIQTIPNRVVQAVFSTLEQRPWIKEFVVVDGNHVYLRGEIEPNSGIFREIKKIEELPEVSKVTNLLSERPKPSVHLQITRFPNELNLSGQISGELLEFIVMQLEGLFPDLLIKDRIQIDDRLGKPLWVDGFEQSLARLQSLQNFEFNGWRDQIFLTGTTDTEFSGRQIGYALPASLVSEVKITNRLSLPTAPRLPTLVIVSDWSGVWIQGTVSSSNIADKLIDAVGFSFGSKQINHHLEINPTLQSSHQLDQLLKLLPSLGDVRDFRLESSDKHFVIWGRVDNPLQLGVILQHRNEIGLEKSVVSEIIVSKADKSATMTLFSDGNRVVLNGLLPTRKTHKNIIEQIRKTLSIDEIKDMTSVEPNIAHSDWLEEWPRLLGMLPRGATGVTINDQSLLLTGNVDSKQQWEIINRNLDQLFPNKTRFNWITTGL